MVGEGLRSSEVAGIRSSEAAFLLPTKQPRAQILARPRFFLFTGYFVNSIEIESI